MRIALRRIQKIKNWAEGTPTYNNCGVSCFDVKGRNCTLTENAKCDFDITNIFNDWFSESPKGDFKDGLLIKIYDKYFGNTSYGYTFATTENSVDTYKPSLSITVVKDPLVRIKNSSSTESEPAYLQVSGSSANSGVGITLHKYSNGDSVNDCASGEIFRLTYNDSKSCYSFYPICSSYGYGTAICATVSGKQATTGTSGNKEWAVHLSSRSADGVNRYSIRETEKTLYLTCSSISDGASVTAGTYEVYGKCYWQFEKIAESGDCSVSTTLYKQEALNTCGLASMRITLAAFKIYKTEGEIKSALNYSVPPTLGKVCDTLNTILTENGRNNTYNYGALKSNLIEAYLLLLKNLDDGYPVITLIDTKNVSSNVLPYETKGHYVVISGLKYNSSSKEMMAIIKDPHYDHSGTYTIPLEALIDYMRAYDEKNDATYYNTGAIGVVYKK